MSRVPISEARDSLADLANRVSLRGERVTVERRGKDLFTMVPIEDAELLERLEDEMDLEIVRKRLNEPGIPFSKLKKELGF